MTGKDPKPPLDSDPNRISPFYLLNILWLTVAFIPSLVVLCSGTEIDSFPAVWFWVLNGGCSFVSGFGLWFGIFRKGFIRGLAGVSTGALFFLANIVVVAIFVVGVAVVNFVTAFYQGCCQGGSGM
jgi:hypothetical protein